jgi:hypothetical protein
MTGGKRPRSGRKPVQIDLEQVEKLCGLQCTDEELAAFLEVGVRTIERRKSQPAFAEAMARGKAKGRVSVRRMLFAAGSKGNIAAAIFLAKNLLAYKDYFSNEHSGPGGGPIVIGPAPELGGLTQDELEQLTSLVGKTTLPRKA